MKKTLAVGIISLSDRTLGFLEKSGVHSLQELIARRDSGLLTTEQFDGESLKELQEACKSFDDFNESLKKNLFPKNTKQISDDRIDNYPVPIKDAVLGLFARVPTRKLSIAEIGVILERVFKGDMDVDYATIAKILVELINEGRIERIDDEGYYRLIKKPSDDNEVFYSFDKMAKLNSFLDANIGKEIEFRYKTNRSQSERRWRRIRLFGQNRNSFYATECYPSGRRIQYTKERVVEYRIAED